MLFLAGYDSMGYELSKPQLRAELESDLKRCVSYCVTYPKHIPYTYMNLY